MVCSASCSQESSNPFLFENSREVLFTLDLSERFLAVAPTCGPVLGVRPEDLIGRSFYDLVNPEDVQDCRQAWHASLADPAISMTVQCRLRRADGTWRIHEVGLAVVLDEWGQPQHFRGLMQDVTERRDTEGRLRSAELLLSAISLASEVLVSGTDFDGSIKQCLQIMGLLVGIDRLTIYQTHPHPTTGKPARSLRFEWCGMGVAMAHPDERANILWDPDFSDSRVELERGQTLKAIVRELPKAKRTRYEKEGRKSFMVVPIFADDEWWGTITFDDFGQERTWSEAEQASLQTLSHNIGSFIGRHQAELVLVQSERLHRTIVDNSKDIIFSLAVSGSILFASPSWKSSLGHDPEEAIGSRIYDYVHEEDVAAFRSFIEGLMEEPSQEGSIDYRIRHADGSWRNHSTSGSVVRGDQGGAELFVGVAKDVTDRVAHEAMLRSLTNKLVTAGEQVMEARDKAIQASQAKSQFLANMSHEIRTPLNGVIGMTSLLLERPLDPDAKEMVAAIQTSGQTLLRVINDILDFSKIEAGKIDIEATPVSVGPLVSDVLSLYQGHARSKGISLFQVPPEAQPPAVLADPVRLRQILANLVSNAAKFTNEGSVSIHWSWSIEDGSAAFQFAVKDTGIGIPEDRLESIFERFTQAEATTTRKYGGSGLGLAICTRLTELMAGRITVNSELGVGTEFHVELSFPLAPSQEPEVGAPASESEDEVRPGLRILVAEDNQINVMVALRLLAKFGCVVDVAEDGMAAIAAAEAAEYDLILMDMQMPLCDGVEATRTIRQQETISGGHRIIIALTANAMEDDRRICQEAGMDGFLAKPVTLGAIREVLLRWAPK